MLIQIFVIDVIHYNADVLIVLIQIFRDTLNMQRKQYWKIMLVILNILSLTYFDNDYTHNIDEFILLTC